MRSEKEAKVGIIGTGFIARGLSYSLRCDKSLEISRVLTRRQPEQVRDLAVENRQITTSIQELIDASDIIVECSGDPVHATRVLMEVMKVGIPVVTMDSELQVTTGSWLAKRGFLKHTPTEEEMRYWANRSGISLEQVTSFTDGTKIQIEQTLVANGLGADIVQRGMLGVQSVDYQDGAKILAERADGAKLKISDYVLSPKSPAGVFIVARHEQEQEPFLRYYKLGDGPYYVLTRPFHLCHLEIAKTIRQVLRGDGVLLNNGENPQISVATIAKRRLTPGEVLKRGVGSFSVRGEAIKIPERVFRDGPGKDCRDNLEINRLRRVGGSVG